MVNITDKWQSEPVGIGSRYEIAWLAQGTSIIDASTLREFESVLRNRKNLKVESVSNLGRVMKTVIRSEMNGTLPQLTGQYIIAGDNRVQYAVAVVLKLAAAPSTAQKIADAAKTAADKIASIPLPGDLRGAGQAFGDKLVDKAGDALEGTLPAFGKGLERLGYFAIAVGGFVVFLYLKGSRI